MSKQLLVDYIPFDVTPQQINESLKKNGKLIIEIAFNQKNEVKKILKDNGFYIIAVIKDLAKNDRCIISKKI